MTPEPTGDAAAVARAFYTAFAQHDAAGMARLYDPQATFQDPVFGRLDAAQAGDMWRMLLGRAPEMTVSSVLLGANDRTARVRWDAHYTFSQTGRRVHNVVHTHLTVQGGLIVEQTDRFDFRVWARQALGLPGLLLGWTPALHRRVSGTALAGLRAFQG